MTNNHHKPGPGRPPVVAEKKVFDVMRPGKTPAQATSRPVIVGHKPQVKDPMMSADRDSQKRSLMDSRSKVTLEPVSVNEDQSQNENAAKPEGQASQMQGPSLADSLAPSAVNTAGLSTVSQQEVSQQKPDSEKGQNSDVDTEPKDTARSQPTVPDTPKTSPAIDDELSDEDIAALNEAAASIDTAAAKTTDTFSTEEAEPEVPEGKTLNAPGAPFNTPLEHHDLLEEHNPPSQPSQEQLTAQKIEEPGRPPVQETAPQEPAEGIPDIPQTGLHGTPTRDLPPAPLPDDQPEVPTHMRNYHDPLPELAEEPAPQQIIVSHHNHSAGRNFMIGIVLLIIAIIIFDLLMDFGMFVIEGLPHTNFF